ncbi:MAG: radical SAM protein [Thermoguttaceae bacterium]|jgi:putative pyruvate formate lyase activating enzyme
MSRTAPHSGEFRLLVKPTGEVVAPDLAAPLLPILHAVGNRDDLPSTERIACPVETPKLTIARLPAIDLSAGDLPSLSTAELWCIHKAALDGSLPRNCRQGASLLDVKTELGRRMLRRCHLCRRRCKVDRIVGRSGFCELTQEANVAGYSMLYNEGPLVGQPTFGVFLGGCSLRCGFCYRSQDLHPRKCQQSTPKKIASLLDQAADAGAESWHFLGGNPDQSLVAVLESLRHVRRSLPIVWNSALYLSRKAIELLKGIVDVWVPDLKFGNDACAHRLAGVQYYSSVVRRNLLVLRGENFVVVRHMRYPGHESCCETVVRRWLKKNLPAAIHHFLDYCALADNAMQSEFQLEQG